MEKIKVDFKVNEETSFNKKMKEEVLSSTKIKKYLLTNQIPESVIDDNLVKVYETMKDLEYCSKCPGIYNCKKNNPHIQSQLTYSYGVLDLEMVPCKKISQRILISKKFIIRDFSDEIMDLSLSAADGKQSWRISLANAYKKHRISGDNSWFYISGAPNTGRSFFTSLIAVDASKDNVGPIIYADAMNRVRELNDAYFKDKERFNELLNLYSNAEFLVLDGLGNEYKNDLIRDNIIFPILQNRSNKKLFTIIISDFEIDELVSLYATDNAGRIKANQIGKIIKASSKTIIQSGDSSIY